VVDGAEEGRAKVKMQKAKMQIKIQKLVDKVG
jgi:hypothetical protein